MRRPFASALFLFLIICVVDETVHAEAIYGVCFEPTGIRLGLNDGQRSETPDGYPNSNPTFFYSSDEPQSLIESWSSALPFPDLLTREEADSIVPPTVTNSVIVYKSETVLHAVSMSQNQSEAYSTTLYLDRNVAIFSQVVLFDVNDMPDFSSVPFPRGAVYAAECEFTVTP